MKFTPEQVIEMAREAGFDVYDMKESPREAIAKATRLCTLAADRALEAAADIVDNADTPDCGGWSACGISDTIRAMKEQQ